VAVFTKPKHYPASQLFGLRNIRAAVLCFPFVNAAITAAVLAAQICHRDADFVLDRDHCAGLKALQRGAANIANRSETSHQRANARSKMPRVIFYVDRCRSAVHQRDSAYLGFTHWPGVASGPALNIHSG